MMLFYRKGNSWNNGRQKTKFANINKTMENNNRRVIIVSSTCMEILQIIKSRPQNITRDWAIYSKFSVEKK